MVKIIKLNRNAPKIWPRSSLKKLDGISATNSPQTAQFYVLYLCWRANLDWGKLTAKVQQSGGISHLQHQLIFFMFEYIFYSTRNCGTRIKKLSKDSFVYYTSVHLFRETLYLVEARRTLCPPLWHVVKHSMHNFSWTVKGLRQKGNGKLPIHF